MVLDRIRVMELQPVGGELDRLFGGGVDKERGEFVFEADGVREEGVYGEDNGELFFERMIEVVN